MPKAARTRRDNRITLAVSAEQELKSAASYIWLGALPIGYVDRLGASGASRLFFIHADHLARPQKITDASRAIVWDGVFAPFGETHSTTGSIVNVLMFPGQLYDPKTALSQNWHRDYDANVGRYIESDPIGEDGGINTYAYVGGNPITRIDPDGRIPLLIPAIPAIPAIGEAIIGLGIAIGLWELGEVCFAPTDCRKIQQKCIEMCSELR